MSEPLTHSDRNPIEQLGEEFVERLRNGERPALSEYIAQRPDLEDEIKTLFPALIMLEQVGSNDGSSLTDVRVTRDGSVPEQIGEYRILREVGRGGMGVVYEAEQESLGRHVALKVLPFAALMDPNHLKRFQREARAAARLHHSNIVPVYGVGEHDGIHYYAMQFIQGQGLDEVFSELKEMRGDQSMPIAVDGPESAPGTDSNLTANGLSSTSGISNGTGADHEYYRSVARIGASAADALSYAHQQGILHRDVKPSNLMLDTDGHVWVTDFGLAKTDAKEDLTHTGDLIGTLRYMAPERFEGWSDPRSDVYGLGLTLYEMLTLQSAYTDADRARLIKRITSEELPQLRRVKRSIPVDIETIVMKSVAKEPGDRYQSADQLAADLRRFLNSEPIQARRASQALRLRMWCQRNPLVATLASSLVVLLVVGMISASWAALHFGQIADGRQQALDDKDKLLRQLGDAEQSASDLATSEHESRLETQRSLYAARLAQARSGRFSGQVGRRFEGLEALAEAASLARELELGEDALLTLRNEAIACMSLVDLRVDKMWPLGGPVVNWGVVYDADVERYALLDPDSNVVIRSLEDNSEIARFPGIGRFGSRQFLRFSPDGRFFAAKKGDGSSIQVAVWDLTTSELVFRAEAGGKTFYRNVDFSPDGRFIAFFTNDGEIGFHDLVEDRSLDPIASPPLISLRYSPDGQQLAAVAHVPENGRGRVLICDCASGEFTQTLEHDRRIDEATWGPDGRTLATPDFDGCVYIWDVETGQHRQVCSRHGAPATRADYSPTGDLIVSVAWEPGNRLWDPRSGRQLLEIEEGVSKFSRNGRWLSMGELGSRTRYAGRLEVARPAVCRVLFGHRSSSEVVGVAFSPDGRLLASAARDDNVRIWDVATQQELAAIDTEGRCRGMTFDPSGRFLITLNNNVTVWPVATSTEDGERFVQIGPPDVIATDRQDTNQPLLTDNSSLVLTSLQEEVLVIDSQPTSQLSATRTGIAGRFVANSPDGCWIATGDKHRQTIEIHDARTGELCRELSAPRGSLVQFSPDGKWLVGSLNGGQFVFWHVGTWTESHQVKLNGRGHSQVAFSSDSQLVAIADSFHVTLLDPASGREIARLATDSREHLSQTYPEGASGIAFSPDDGMLAVGSDDGPVQLWDLREIRTNLAEMGLDWNHPPIPPSTRESPPTCVAVIGANSLGRLAELAELNQAVAEDPQDFESHKQRIITLFRLRRYNAMIVDANRMIEIWPERNDGYFWRGRACMGLYQDEQAIADIHKSLSIRPADFWAVRNLAWLYALSPDEVRDLETARQMAIEAGRLRPENNFWKDVLGLIHYRRGEVDEAIQVLQSVSGPERYGVVQQVLAMCYHKLGRTDDALRHLDQVDDAWGPNLEPFWDRVRLTLQAEIETLGIRDEMSQDSISLP